MGKGDTIAGKGHGDPMKKLKSGAKSWSGSVINLLWGFQSLLLLSRSVSFSVK